MKVRLEKDNCGTYLLVPVATNREIKNMGFKNRKELCDELEVLIQVDFDRCGVASSFGWNPCRHCDQSCQGSTDGTIDCDKYKVWEFITDATDYLDWHTGKVIEDPGYFEGY